MRSSSCRTTWLCPLGVITQTMMNAMILGSLKQLLKKWILLKSSSAAMLPFPTFSPSHLMLATSIYIEGVIFMVTPFTVVSSLSSFTFRLVKKSFTKFGSQSTQGTSPTPVVPAMY